jgi:hypothetical protein
MPHRCRPCADLERADPNPQLPKERTVNIDELRGRQLDLMIARHVFGHEVEEHPNIRTGEVDAVYSPSLRTSNATWVRVPSYCKTPAALMQVEVEVQKRGWKRTEAPLGSVGSDGDVRVVLENTEGRTVEASGSLNEAICRAALKAALKTAVAT